MMTIEQFCEKYGACEPIANCKTMQEAWDRATEPEWVVWIATQPGVLTDRELRLFVCFCARQNWYLLTDPRSRNVVEVAERYANGQASLEELTEARRAAEAAWSAAEAAWSAARAAWAAARARAVAWTAAWTVEEAAWAVAWAVAWTAAWAVEADGTVAAQQAEWLRKNTKPNFD